jgi:hypothetical protein
MAVPYLASEAGEVAGALAFLQDTLKKLIEGFVLNPRCELCSAQQERWTYEAAPTIYETLDEAMPHLKRLEAEQIQLQATLRQLKKAKNN